MGSVSNRDVVVVASSAGGIEALSELVGGLDPSYRGVVLVVLHIPSNGGNSLVRILQRRCPLPVTAARDGMALSGGQVMVCVPDHHLLLGDGKVLVRRGPKENGHRPAADPLFRSAARYYGPRAVGVVMSGALSDGTAGLRSIRDQGGLSIIQDPDEALFDAMPTSALEHVGADHVLAAADIGPLLQRLAVEEAVTGSTSADDERLRREVQLMEEDDGVVDREHPGRPSRWPCPDCSGVLWQIEEKDVLRFRCRVGHAWDAESLLDEQAGEVEEALWAALRSLEDRVDLARTLGDRAESAGRPHSADRFRSNLEDMERNVEVLRRLLERAVSPEVSRD
jgi:two-component system chemotaxis response regulator CheB